MSKRAVAFVRLTGVLLALVSVGGAAYVIARLYTGRGGAAPIRAAIYEQPLVALLGLAGSALGAWMALQPRQVADARAWLNPRWVWRERRAEAALLAISLVIALLLLEAGSRALYARDERLPYFFPPEYLVYPPLYHVMRDYSPDATNVLLLGGSVLNGAGQSRKLESALDSGWRVYNVAQNAHSSLDSVTKYRWLTEHGYRFDYVVFYHGINDVRANNAPPDVFRDDYSHYLFYRLVHAAFGDDHPIRRAALHSALVFRADRLITQLRETRAFGRNFVNIAYPREDWLAYGSEIRSAKPFESNLIAIGELAHKYDAELVVFEFAYDPRLDGYVAGDLSEAPEDGMVEYAKEWGLPENVQKGIGAHNRALRANAARYRFVPTDSLKQSANFVDPCHFTAEAELEFVELIAGALDSAETSR